MLKAALAALAVAGPALVVFAPGSVDADACLSGSPTQPSDVRGYTFRMRFDGHDRMNSITAYRGLVEHVYARKNADLPFDLSDGSAVTLYSERCVGIIGPLPPGTYLISTADILQLPMRTTAVWRLDGGAATFVETGTRKAAASFHRARTVDAALALVVPGTLPPTDAVMVGMAPVESSGPALGGLPALLLGMSWLAVTAIWTYRRQRLT